MTTPTIINTNDIVVTLDTTPVKQHLTDWSALLSQVTHPSENDTLEVQLERIAQLRDYLAGVKKSAVSRRDTAHKNLLISGRSKTDANVFKNFQAVNLYTQMETHLTLLEHKVRGLEASELDVKGILEKHDILTEPYMGRLSAHDEAELIEASFSWLAQPTRGFQELSKRIANYGTLTAHKDGYALTINGKQIVISGESAHRLIVTPKTGTWQRAAWDTQCIITPSAETQRVFHYNGHTLLQKPQALVDVYGTTHKLTKTFRVSFDSLIYRVLYQMVAFAKYPTLEATKRWEEKAEINAHLFGDATHVANNLSEFNRATIGYWYFTLEVEDQKLEHTVTNRNGKPGYLLGTTWEDMQTQEAWDKVNEYWMYIHQDAKGRKEFKAQHKTV